MGDTKPKRDAWVVERAGRSDYGELLPFLDGVFGKPAGGFKRDYGHIYRPTEEAMARNRVIRDGGKIVGAFGVFPMRFPVPGGALQANGVGGVATGAEHQGRGIMSAFLRHASREMFDAGDDISILWGARERYGRHGWETAGVKYSHGLPGGAPWGQPGRGVRKLSPARDLQAAHEAFMRLPLRVDRALDSMRLCVKRAGYEYYVSDAKTPFAYAAVTRAPANRVAEMAGDVAGVENILAWLARRREGGGLSVYVPDAATPMAERVRRLAGYSGAATLGSIKIVNLTSTVRKLLPAINRNLRPAEASGRLTLEMSDKADQKQRVTLELGPKVRIAAESCGARRVSLTDREMSRLIFGHAGERRMWDLKGRAGALRHLFPVPLYIHEPDHV